MLWDAVPWAVTATAALDLLQSCFFCPALGRGLELCYLCRFPCIGHAVEIPQAPLRVRVILGLLGFAPGGGGVPLGGPVAQTINRSFMRCFRDPKLAVIL